MLFKIPTPGTRFVINQEMIVDNIEEHYELRCLTAFKSCNIRTELKTYYDGTPYTETTPYGSFTFPAGTIFKIEDMRFTSLRDKSLVCEYEDQIAVSVFDTPLEYLIDDEITLTKTGKVSKVQKQKAKPYIQLYISLEFFQTIDCDIVV